MDSTIPPSLTNVPKDSDRKRWFALGAGLVLLGLLAYGAYTFLGNGVLFNDTVGSQIILAPEVPPLFPAQVLDREAGTRRPVSVDDQGTFVILDVAYTDTHAYYLLAEPGLSFSNLYREEFEGATPGLEQVTDSDTLKYALSVDDVSGTAAYVTDAPDGLHVVAWDPSTGEETDLGPGTSPTVIASGFFVAFLNAGAVKSVDLTTGESHELVSVSPGMPFAISATEGKIALYNPVTGEVELFSITAVTSASYESSTALEDVPAELLFADDTVVVAVPDGEDDDTFALRTLGGRELGRIDTGGRSLVTASLTLLQ